MTGRACLSLVLIALTLSLANCRSAPDFDRAPDHARTLYAQGNLRVTKGWFLDWRNWQRYESFIPVGTALEVWPRSGSTFEDDSTVGSASRTRSWYMLDPVTGSSYRLEMGSRDGRVLDRFLGPRRPDLSGSSKAVREAIEESRAMSGMTKVEVLAALGPPARAGADQAYTRDRTREELFATDRWIYATSRGGRWIVVEFDPESGRAKAIEGQ